MGEDKVGRFSETRCIFTQFLDTLCSICVAYESDQKLSHQCTFSQIFLATFSKHWISQ